jgi:small conductance mechanosensitive channel
MEGRMDNLWEGVLEFLASASADLALKIIGALVMLVIGFKVIKFAMHLFGKSLAKSKLDKGIQGFLENGVSIALHVMLVISILMYIGVPAASFIAILTSAGLAIGLALQGSLSNFAGGLMILFFRPFRAGDFIKTDTAEGNVQNISIMYTTLKTLDGKKVVIPNAMLSNGVITDFSWYENRRIDLTITTDFKEEVQAVRDLLENIAREHEMVLDDPAPAASLDKIQDGALVFTLRCWARTGDWWTTSLALTATAKQRLQEQKITLRGPIREVRQV